MVTQSMHGDCFLRDFLRSSRSPLRAAILEKAQVVVIPVINTIGNRADARCCPRQAWHAPHTTTRCITVLGLARTPEWSTMTIVGLCEWAPMSMAV